MVETARNLERMAARFDPLILIVAGLACVIVGLFVWLGGLGLRKFLVIVVGALSGWLCGFFIIGLNIMLAVVLAAVASVVAVIFERTFIPILAAGLAAILGFVVLARPYIEISDDFITRIKQACLQMPAYNWAIVAALALIYILAGIFFWR